MPTVLLIKTKAVSDHVVKVVIMVIYISIIIKKEEKGLGGIYVDTN